MENKEPHKLLLPKKDYLLYKNLYKYLHETLYIGDSSHVTHTSLVTSLLRYYRSQQATVPTAKEEDVIISAQNIFPFAEKRSMDDDTNLLDTLKEDVRTCTQCPLHKERQQFVDFGTMGLCSLMVIVDQPSYYDETQGRLLSEDNAGNLLKKILHALGLDAGKCYFTAAMKCASVKELPYDLTPMKPCTAYLHQEIKWLKPKWLLAFGEATYRYLFHEDYKSLDLETLDAQKLSALFQNVAGKKLHYQETPIVFTHHPKELLMDTHLKKETWEHLLPYRSELQAIVNRF